ncbi:hypothetical protein GETHLI_34930 [Geothrix limicola]|uniref:Uncharacterized protein n=1 Tax=Geothrix limicola TaxID=2927978 RepID=A0ABQ5QL25_9BACT|nr:hypothetical protein GETHLI_34930 [Geothrix limicola]
MANGVSLDRRKHRGPFRILHMNFADFVKRFFLRGALRR